MKPNSVIAIGIVCMFASTTILAVCGHEGMALFVFLAAGLYFREAI